MSLSPALADPLKQTLAAEGQNVLDEFTALIGAAVQGLIAKSPALGAGAALLLEVGHVFAQAELGNLLAHNSHVQGSSTEPLPPIQTAPTYASLLEQQSPAAPAAQPEPQGGGAPAEPGGQPQHVPPPEPPPPPAPGEPGGQPRPDPLEQPSTGPFGLTS